MKNIEFIFRKPNVKYKSIEGVFKTIIKEISNNYNISIVNNKYSGGSPSVIYKNCKNFKKNKKKIFHITGDTHYIAFVTGSKTILTIHDVGSANNGIFIKKIYIKLLWFWLPALFVKYITVISNFTKSELEKVIPFASHKIKVIPNPVSDSFKPKLSIFNKKCPIILLVGTKKNKNIERVFYATSKINCKLIIIGYMSDAQIDLLDELKINYVNRVNLSNINLVRTYEECDLLCFPSTYEGFGMPIIEAQAIGRAVLTSNLGAMIETAQTSACLVNPFSVESIRKGLLKIINDSTYRENLIKMGFINVQRFQTDCITKQYLNIYNKLG